MSIVKNTRIRTIIVITLAVIIGLGVSGMSKYSYYRSEQERAAYLNNKEAQYIARYGHPEITEQLNRQFDETVIPALITGTQDFLKCMSNPVKSLANYEEGTMCLNILEELSLIPQNDK